VLRRFPRASVHPFCLETLHPEASFHARHFSSPYSGTVEDPVTGTASGVLGAWWLIKTGAPEVNLVVEQGAEVGRDGLVEVGARARDGQIEVSIAGTAVRISDEQTIAAGTPRPQRKSED
jgi:PhzF family phenazine biosynthesis protein